MKPIEIIKDILPGLVIAGLLAFCAVITADYTSIPVMLLCLFFGIGWSALFKTGKVQAGVDFTARTVLRLGVILIGARLSFDHFTALGAEMIVMVMFATLFVIGSAMVCSRFLKFDRELATLIGGGTAICGASAILALSSVMPRSKTLDENTVSAVIAVTLMGTILMVSYPLFSGYLGLEEQQIGFLIGGTIHDVSQTVAAGYSVSEDVGDNAILVKLIRVFLLVPVLFVFAIALSARKPDQTKASMLSAFPWFILGFVALVVTNSTGLVPEEFVGYLAQLSKICLIMAITAVGMKTSIPFLLSVGWRPVLLVLVETLFLFTFYISVL